MYKVCYAYTCSAACVAVEYVSRLIAEVDPRAQGGLPRRQDRGLPGQVSAKGLRGGEVLHGCGNTSRFSHKSICQNKIIHCSEDGLGAILREMFVIGVEAESGILRWGIRILCVNKVSDFPLKILLDPRKLFEFSNKCSFRMCRGESRTRSTTSSRRTRTWSGRTGRGERDGIIF